MNKQELIKRITDLPSDCSRTRPMIDKLTVLELIKLLNKTKKVKIPKLVAEYIEQKKAEDYHLLGAIAEIRSHKNKEIDEWFYTDDNIDIFARAWLDGYTIEKEPKYTVKCKTTKQYLSNDELGPHFEPNFRSNFTKSDLEKLGLGWVFDCEGMEVEKV